MIILQNTEIHVQSFRRPDLVETFWDWATVLVAVSFDFEIFMRKAGNVQALVTRNFKTKEKKCFMIFFKELMML